jgi:hypothetical protein
MAMYAEIKPEFVVDAEVWDPERSPHVAVTPYTRSNGQPGGVIYRAQSTQKVDCSVYLEPGWWVTTFIQPNGQAHYEALSPEDFAAWFRPYDPPKEAKARVLAAKNEDSDSLFPSKTKGK